MFPWLKKQAISFLSIPPEPEPPAGSPSSLLVFRASPAYQRYRMALWLLGRVLVLLLSVIVAGYLMLIAVAIASEVAPKPHDGAQVAPEASAQPGKKKHKPPPWEKAAPEVVRAIFIVFGSMAVVWFVGHSAISYVLMKLDYELRWYKVTDRSLRIREGVWKVKEMTMSFANIQNISLSQGPLQKYFGVADLMVESAGGGASQPGAESLHRGYFRGVDNAEQIRDMMQQRLRALKDGGLGDHEDRGANATARAPHQVTHTSPPAHDGEVAVEVSSLLEEAVAFRAAAERLERVAGR